MRAHPLADLFPMMSPREFADLRADVAAHGLTDPIVTLDGMILDGRNRHAACLAEGITPHFRAFDAARGKPLDFVISKNLRRRHLDESQRAMVAERVATLTNGQRGDLVQAPSIEGAAAMLNVSVASIERARIVRRAGVDDLARAVTDGLVSVSAAAGVATLPRAEQAEIVARGPKEILAAAKAIRAGVADQRRAARVAGVGQLADTSSRLAGFAKYPILYADPPWRFAAGDTDRSVENHYRTMTVAEICALPVRALATDVAALFLWATVPHRRGAFDVLDAWGFQQVSEIAWDKQVDGMGHWTRNRHEILVIAKRGDFPAPKPGTQLSSLYSARRGRHSEKPAGIAEWIERTWPDLPKLELFCRARRPGWDVWGNQAEAAA